MKICGFVFTSWSFFNAGYATWQITFSVCEVHLTPSPSVYKYIV